jgi:PIN domain nuclease of toxin-antitoxin system
VRILLDTHALLWFVAGDAQLSAAARSAIEEAADLPLVSIASVWEIGIKISLGKLDVGVPLGTFVRDHILGNGMEILAITPAHIERVVRLPFHHRDPFDRLLVAQALEESVSIVGRDAEFSKYGIALVW